MLSSFSIANTKTVKNIKLTYVNKFTNNPNQAKLHYKVDTNTLQGLVATSHTCCQSQSTTNAK